MNVLARLTPGRHDPWDRRLSKQREGHRLARDIFIPVTIQLGMSSFQSLLRHCRSLHDDSCLGSASQLLTAGR